MDKYLKGYEVNFVFDIRTDCKIKFFDYHITKPWIAYVTQNNIFALWDYQRKICIKSFTTTILDPAPNDNLMISLSGKSNDLKNLKFLDKETLHWLYPSSQPITGKELDILDSFTRNNIIFFNEQKIVFYNYVTDQSDIVGPSVLDNKSIKCISVMNYQYLLIGCVDGLIKVFDMVTWTLAKTLKGYHTKSINCIKSFKQNLINRTKFIVASTDGLMACWGVELDNNPAFKFTMLKKGKQVFSMFFLHTIKK